MTPKELREAIELLLSKKTLTEAEIAKLYAMRHEYTRMTGKVI